MGIASPEKIVQQIFNTITEEGVTVHQLVCKTGLDHRTVKKYIGIMIDIQKAQKISKVQYGLRIIIKKTSAYIK